jgi:hypothetical protein
VPVRRRQLIELAGFALLVVGCLQALPWLSTRLTAHHLQQRAAERLDRLRHGSALWQWQPRQPPDLIAGRAFGKARLEARQTGLRATSFDGSPFELGLRLEQPIDLHHWPRLRLHIDSDRGGQLGLLTASATDQSVCRTSLGTVLAAGVQQAIIDARSQDWRDARGQACQPARAIGMLRLSLQLPAGSWLTLSDLALLPASPSTPPAPTAGRADPLGETTDRASPALVLDATSAAERLLAARDRALQTWPGAVVAVGDMPEPAAAPSPRQWPEWLGLAAYVIGLLTLVCRRAPSRWLVGMACLPGPLWLLAGLQLGQRISLPAAMAFLAALLYAGLLSWRERPADWRWRGPPSSWLIALIPLPLALLLWQLRGHPLQALPPLHVVTYFGWAALQQWLMLVVLLRHLDGLPRLLGILLTALVFALLHTPNGLLMQLCFIAELVWAWQFQRQRTLLPIAVAHTLCALLLEAGVVGGPLRSLEVSARFFS